MLIYLNNKLKDNFYYYLRCGLVAMMMAINLVKPKLKLKLEDCLESAKSYGFTKQGEMFSGNLKKTFFWNFLKFLF